MITDGHEPEPPPLPPVPVPPPVVPPEGGGVDEPEGVCDEGEEEPPPQAAMKAKRIKAAIRIES